jgi:hypothetical protein
VFADNDGIVEPWPTESFVFFVVVEDEGNTPVEPAEARVEFLSKGKIVQAMELSSQALQMVRDVRFKTPRVALPEAFDLRHQLSVPVSLNVDRVRYRLMLTRGSAAFAAYLEIPLERYESKAELLCPVKGRFMIVSGHDANEPHALGWSQQHAYDIMSLGSSFGFARNEGRQNDEYFSWGQPVLAPADGVVVSSRNDVFDQPRPGVVDAKLYETLPDPRSAYTGNTIVIDHGQGEYSALSHLQRGSVQVKSEAEAERDEDRPSADPETRGSARTPRDRAVPGWPPDRRGRTRHTSCERRRDSAARSSRPPLEKREYIVPPSSVRYSRSNTTRNIPPPQSSTRSRRRSPAAWNALTTTSGRTP